MDTCRSSRARAVTSITIKVVCVEHSFALWHLRALKGQLKPAVMNNPSATPGLPAAAGARSVTSIICRGGRTAQREWRPARGGGHIGVCPKKGEWFV